MKAIEAQLISELAKNGSDPVLERIFARIKESASRGHTKFLYDVSVNSVNAETIDKLRNLGYKVHTSSADEQLLSLDWGIIIQSVDNVISISW